MMLAFTRAFDGAIDDVDLFETAIPDRLDDCPAGAAGAEDDGRAMPVPARMAFVERWASRPRAASDPVSSRGARAHLTQAVARLFLVHTTHYAGGIPKDPAAAIALLENGGHAKPRGRSPRPTQHVGKQKEGVAGLLAALPALSKPARGK